MPTADLAPCDVCKSGETSEFNFLLNCYICKRGFHHRCCQPPIRDVVLTSLINATLKNKPGKGVKFWRCYDCREGKASPAVGSSILVGPGASSSNALLSNLKKRKQDEVIVISDDDDEPLGEIVVSSRPPVQRQGSLHAVPPSVVKSAEPRVSGGSPIPRLHSPPKKQGESKTRDRTQTPPIPPSTSVVQVPSTSRFGLLSPPVSIGGSSMRYPSTTPFFIDSDESRGLSKPRTETETHEEPSSISVQGTPPTPPKSTRTQSPLVHESTASVPRTWRSQTVRQDLKLLSREFGEKYRADLKARATTASCTRQQKQPRKPVSTRSLNTDHRTSSQQSFCHLGTPE